MTYDAYARELGVHVYNSIKETYGAALRNFWKNMFKPYYRGEVDVDGKRIALIELPPEYMPKGVLGMTDCFSTIWMRDDLEKFYGLRKRVLRHEKRHVSHPEEDELTVRKRTDTVSIEPYRLAA